MASFPRIRTTWKLEIMLWRYVIRYQITVTASLLSSWLVNNYRRLIFPIYCRVISVIFMETFRHVFVWVYSRESSRGKTRGIMMLGRPFSVLQIHVRPFCCHHELCKARKRYCGNSAVREMLSAFRSVSKMFRNWGKMFLKAWLN